MNANQSKISLYVDYLLLIALSAIEYMDITIRIIAGILGVVLTIYLIRATMAKTRVDYLNAQIKEQELGSIIEDNLRKSMEGKDKIILK